MTEWVVVAAGNPESPDKEVRGQMIELLMGARKHHGSCSLYGFIKSPTVAGERVEESVEVVDDHSEHRHRSVTMNRLTYISTALKYKWEEIFRRGERKGTEIERKSIVILVGPVTSRFITIFVAPFYRRGERLFSVIATESHFKPRQVYCRLVGRPNAEAIEIEEEGGEMVGWERCLWSPQGLKD